MDKLKLHTPDLTASNIEKLAELFPGCITEARDENGRLTHTVDFDQLRQELSPSVLEGPRERYHLDWPGKHEAIVAANTPITKTMRPRREDSIDFDITGNVFIEGDNLDALKLMQETYLGKVKMIYIDPPYNTGNDLIYQDNFVQDSETYLIRSNQSDETEGRLVLNTNANGRFHSDWLSMIYPRLRLARNLLREDGFLFVSIDGEELANLRIMCDEIFGPANHCGIVSRITGTRMGSGSRTIAKELDYILIYSRSVDAEFPGLEMTDGEAGIYDLEDSKGRYLLRSLRRTGGENRREDRPSMYYAVESPDGDDIFPIAPAGYESRWVCSEATYKELLRTGMIEWKKMLRDGTAKWQVYQKHYLGEGLKQPSNLWNEEEGNKKATRDLNDLFDGLKVFDHPKPLGLMQKLLTLSTSRQGHDLIVDFFAGSGTTAHAVMSQNARDSGDRRFILVQVAEPLASDNRAQQVAAKVCEDHGLSRTVAEITKERMRRAGAKIKSETATSAPHLDVGFRVMKVDTSCMKDVYYAPDEVKQADLLAHLDNIREDRTPEDLLFQVLVDWGVDLALPIATEQIEGKAVFFVDQTALAACFETNVSEDLVKTVARRKPLRAVFRDRSYGSDSVKINVEQIFKLLSPSTEVKSL